MRKSGHFPDDIGEPLGMTCANEVFLALPGSEQYSGAAAREYAFIP